MIFCEEEIVVCSVASVAWCVFLSGDAKKGKNEKALPCAHITQGIYEEKSIALSSFATFFFTFQKEEREREIDIDICREDNT